MPDTNHLGRNHFELLGLPVAYSIDALSLERGYRDLQSRVHPDKFAAATEPERRVAMQWAAQANEAYRTLRNPVERARYLLALKGFDTEEESNTAMPADFLMAQMELREELEDAVDSESGAKLASVRDKLQGGRGALLLEIEAQLGARAWNEAAGTLRRLMFMEKLGEEIAAAEDDL